ncbi:MAG: hypothetical protein Q8R04_06985 [Nanoarchaeota archaeon]|nr:hypothetical protein [Nanoarchaeota archaeon]
MQIRKYYRHSFYKIKKAVVHTILIQLIGAILFVVIGGAILIILLKLSGIFLSGKDYESTIKSFNLLGGKIDDLVKDRNYVNANLLYFLDKNYILVGYNYKDPSIQMQSCNNEMLTESRKKIRGICDKACLCIYKDNTLSNDFDGDIVPLQCKSFDKNIVFLAPSNQQSFCSVQTGWNPNAYPNYYQADQKYKFLILYGFNTKEIYIDKYESSDGNIFVFLAEYKSEEPLVQRKKFMEDRYGKETK